MGVGRLEVPTTSRSTYYHREPVQPVVTCPPVRGPTSCSTRRAARRSSSRTIPSGRQKEAQGDAARSPPRRVGPARLASTREIIERERPVTAGLLDPARRPAVAKPKAPRPVACRWRRSTAGRRQGRRHPVEQLEQRQDACRTRTRSASTSTVPRPTSTRRSADGPTRNEARLGLEAVAKNADKLGDDIDRGEVSARPTETGNPTDAAAMKKLGELEPRTLAISDEAPDAIKVEQERLAALPRPSNAPAGAAYKAARRLSQGDRQGRREQKTIKREDRGRAAAARTSDPAAPRSASRPCATARRSCGTPRRSLSRYGPRAAAGILVQVQAASSTTTSARACAPSAARTTSTRRTRAARARSSAIPRSARAQALVRRPRSSTCAAR